MNISDAAALTNQNNSTTSTGTTSNLGKDDFLKLLVTQIQYQDPMNPMDDTAFVAQMAQFSSLEQMQNVATSLSMSQAISMIGAQVSWYDSQGYEYRGPVTAVTIVSGNPKLIIDGKIAIDFADVKLVEPITTTTGTDETAET